MFHTIYYNIEQLTNTIAILINECYCMLEICFLPSFQGTEAFKINLWAAKSRSILIDNCVDYIACKSIRDREVYNIYEISG